MWVIQRDWILQVSKCTSMILDEVDIRIYWKADKDPDILSFESEDSAKVSFDKIVKGIADGEKIVRVLDTCD